MSLQASFSPFLETRFFQAGSYIYKFKIRGGNSFSAEEVIERHSFNQELEEIIRTVLGNLKSLQPFSSTNFIVFPYKKPWEGKSMVMCKHGERKLRAWPFTLILYLEKRKTQGGKQEEEKWKAENQEADSEPQSKRRKSDSPLEDAIIKDLIKDMEAESKVSTAGAHMDTSQAERTSPDHPGHADKKGTKGFDEAWDESGIDTFRGSVREEPCWTGEDMEEEEEEGEEEGENADPVPGSPSRPGMLTRLASLVFPFLFYRER